MLWREGLHDRWCSTSNSSSSFTNRPITCSRLNPCISSFFTRSSSSLFVILIFTCGCAHDAASFPPSSLCFSGSPPEVVAFPPQPRLCLELKEPQSSPAKIIVDDWLLQQLPISVILSSVLSFFFFLGLQNDFNFGNWKLGEIFCLNREREGKGEGRGGKRPRRRNCHGGREWRR